MCYRALCTVFNVLLAFWIVPYHVAYDNAIFIPLLTVQSPFEQLRLGMRDITGDDGVLKKTITQGIGAEVPEGAIVRVHYNGYLEYSDEPYDSSRLRNRLHQFRLGGGGCVPYLHVHALSSWLLIRCHAGEVLLGWDMGVKTMRKNEKAEFLLSPKYAFGQMGCPPRIPPDASSKTQGKMSLDLIHKLLFLFSC